ncbi:MAG: hypothetical protein COA33_010080 [Fluviicola sp.]|nr:hypothetical protein [Fluviicola sp.]
MKTLTIAIALLLSSASFAQTDVISNKSHSGDLSELYLEPDDFGAPDYFFKRDVDSVIYYKKTCFIEVRKEHISINVFIFRRDTICSLDAVPKNKSELDSFKTRYPASTQFIGFEKIEKKKAERKINSISFFFGILILLIALYSFLPLLRKKA